MELIVMALATYRISSLLVHEEGPFNVFGRFRTLLGIYWDQYSEPQANNMIGRAFTCVWCLSLWVAIALVVAHYLSPFYTFWLTLPFALSAVAIVIERFANGEK